MERITIPRTIVNQLLAQAQASSQQEICGLISAADGIPTRCYQVENIASHPDTQFLLNPEIQIRAMKQIREQGESLFGIYHSHPHSPPLPSKSDTIQTAYSKVLYFIISLNIKGVLEMRCFKFQQGAYRELELEL
ncbi:M67 family metallopeptidase [Candidatus Nitrosacidococcus sp. I8]|uniref:M67 family metallopeptidase n=1 Tax=Candidatus Nitrosacidococcus sp. I8 TaxID=2942908 RepID=UPI002226F66B|nr:M67 family metallopeptidase [Candidatus Nitrosacidococcus sp. I8]CAH9019667.1 putative TtuB-protein conjugate cleaving protease [Candidatus Nitrosacidococcus sp. I8]